MHNQRATRADNISRLYQKLRQAPLGLWMVIIIIANLTACVILVKDYGESWDEHLRIRYADRTLAAYRGEREAPKDEKGPFYVVAARLGSAALQRIAPGLGEIQSWHTMHFLSFLMGLVFLYQICLQFVGPPAALLAVLLFNLQPLLWGHAFINAKDIPFMSFFLGSMALGLRMVEQLSLEKRDKSLAVPSPPFPGRAGWRKLSPTWRVLILGLSSASIISLFALFFYQQQIIDTLSRSVRQVYETGPSGLLGNLIDRLMTNRQIVPLDAYYLKIQFQIPRLVRTYFIVILLIHLVAAAYLNWPSTQWLWRYRCLPILSPVWASLKKPDLLAAGLFLGLCSAIRVMGPFSGLLVGLYLLNRRGKKAWPALIGYILVGFLVTYLAWPRLWPNPIQNYLYSFSKAFAFPWEGKVLYAGKGYNVDAMPRTYLPALMAMQFTETMLGVTLLGLGLAIIKLIKYPNERGRLAVILAWYVLPIGAAVALQPTFYDNFRQFMFTVTPLFILGAIGIQFVFERLHRPSWKALFGMALLFPCFISLVQLHPYQYTYYNQLAGGVSGVFRKYELDYWAISYQQAVDYLNQNAPENARIIVWGADHLVSRRARKDLQIYDYRQVRDEKPENYDYAVVSTRHNKDLELYINAPIVWQAERSGAVFSVVRQLNNNSP